MTACQYDIMPAIHHRDKTSDSHQSFRGDKNSQSDPKKDIVGGFCLGVSLGLVPARILPN